MSKSIEPVTGSQSRLRAALSRVRPQMAALDRDSLLVVNLERFVAASVVRATLPGLTCLRSELLAFIPPMGGALFVRRHRDDADRFAPSLYRKRTARRSAPSTKQATKSDAAAAEVEAPVGVTEHTADSQVTPAPRVPTKLTDPVIH